MIYGGRRLDSRRPHPRGPRIALNRPEPIPAPHAVEVQDGLPNPQRMLAFTTLAMAVSMAVLDGTIVTVALPTMARQFSVAPENAIWIVNAFQLAVTVSLLPLAALGDILGYRRVYWWGLALFTVASLACALAPNFAVLTLARVVQGLGAAGNHERQHCAHPLRLSARAAWPGGRQPGGGGRRLLGRQPERRGGDPVGRLLALAVSDQRADRDHCARDGGADAAGDAAIGRPARSSERHSQRVYFRARHRRREPHRPGRVPLAGADRDRGRRRIRRGARLAATETPRAAAAGRSSAPAGVRAFARDVYRLIWGASAGDRVIAVLL